MMALEDRRRRPLSLFFFFSTGYMDGKKNRDKFTWGAFTGYADESATPPFWPPFTDLYIYIRVATHIQSGPTVHG